MPARGLSARWVERRKPSWDRLDTLVNTCDRGGVRALPHADLRELASLYRQTAADLSVVRDDPTSGALARYLNTLLGRAHNHIYSGTRPQAMGIVHFYAHVFPGVVRETLPFTVAAVLLFALGMIAGVAMSAVDPGFERVILGTPMMETIDQGHMWTHSIVSIKPLASSAIMTNNISVSFGAFAGGILAGVGTVYMLLFNGLLMGVVAMACHRAGLTLSLWSFVAPHGVLELPAIFMAGGAGLLMAKGLLVPGERPRRESLADAARRGVRLVLGVIPMLIVAGIVEGFVSPSDAGAAVKFVVAGGLLVLLAGYVTLVGPTPDSAA